jgi:hypothetical protein
MGGEVVGIRRVVVWKLPVCPRMNVLQVEIHVGIFVLQRARLGWAPTQLNFASFKYLATRVQKIQRKIFLGR